VSSARCGSAHQRRGRLYGLSLQRIINGLTKAGVEIDRKVLADIAVHDTAAFGRIAQQQRALSYRLTGRGWVLAD